MGEQKFPRAAMRKIEKRDAFPLIALAGIKDLRDYLDELETETIVRARELGASAADIADALGITRQGAHYKLKALSGEKGMSHELSASHAEAASPESVTVIVLPDLVEADNPEGSRL